MQDSQVIKAFRYRYTLPTRYGGGVDISNWGKTCLWKQYSEIKTRNHGSAININQLQCQLSECGLLVRRGSQNSCTVFPGCTNTFLRLWAIPHTFLEFICTAHLFLTTLSHLVYTAQNRDVKNKTNQGTKGCEKKQFFNYLYTNARSPSNKQKDLKLLIYEH